MSVVMTGNGTGSAESESKQSSPQQFTETRWSKVLLASKGDSPPSHQALGDLCQRYWHSIYAFLRREGCSPQDAEDLTQQFFCFLLEKNTLAAADPARGRFRTFLLNALKNFRIDQARKEGALKRGGGKAILSLDQEEAEQRYVQEPDPGLTPEKVYDQQWATTLLDQALRRLRSEFEEGGQGVKFECFKTFLSTEPNAGEYEQVANRLGMTRRAVTGAIYRLRQRYHQLIRLEVAETVSNSEEIEREMRDLFK